MQAFDGVNKRVSRLAANIPLIKANLAPLAFADVSRDAYTEAILGVYELNQVDLLKDIFIWAYERSALRYATVKQSLGEPDAFRMKYRDALQKMINDIIHKQMNKKDAFAYIATWAAENIEKPEQEKYREIGESEVLGLHEGNFARYRVRPSEFQAWREVWDSDR